VPPPPSDRVDCEIDDAIEVIVAAGDPSVVEAVSTGVSTRRSNRRGEALPIQSKQDGAHPLTPPLRCAKESGRMK
jgi:hypothetical protein